MPGPHDDDIAACRAALAALDAQRATLGDAVVELASEPLRARLAQLQRSSGLQHRQVTVLFADVVGSTTMAQRLDAEDTLALLSGATRTMASLIEAHHGRVLRFTGDGIKAAFGMDEAREDDAERAVRAGLAILAAGRELAQAAQRRHGIADFALRVGVHTGDVALGAGVEADNTAMGAAVNIAARMEQSAPPGALRISQDTWGLVRGLFALEPQPALQVKGVDAPMKTYLVQAALERSVASVERGLQGLSTPLVGRQDELQRLLDSVARADATRQLQAITLVGDAGLGKSRLLRELAAHLRAAPAPRRLFTLRSQPDGLLRPWGLLRALLATHCGVTDTDTAEAARDKVVATLSPGFDAHGERQAQLIGQLAGLDFGDSPHLRGLGPRALRDQAFAALHAFFRGLAAEGAGVPVLIAEDLHWADDGSLDWLQHLQAHAAELPLALVMTARPALLERRPAWGPAEATLALRPLAAANQDELAQALLQRIDGVPPRLRTLIVDRAEGNPYYMEELVRRLVDDGVIVTGEPHWTVDTARLDDLRLPGTLVGLLQARLDALPADERQAARRASIIGHVFWDDALQALDAEAPRALPALQRAAVVKAHDTSAFDGTPERQFDHHLLHQVTYDTLIKSERRLGHGAAARWLQARTQGRGAEFLAMTGEHAERAGETALAVDCFEQAGREAQRRFAAAAARAYLRRAVTLLGDTDPGRRMDLLSSIGDIADMVGDRAAQDALHDEEEALLVRHPDDAHRARLKFSRALLADRRGDAAASEPLAREAVELAERCGAARWAAMGHGQLAWLHLARRDHAGAAPHLAQGLPWAARVPDETIRLRTEAQLLTLSAIASMQQSRCAEAHAALQEVLARGEAIADPRLQLGALEYLASLDSDRGRWRSTVAWAERVRGLGQAIGSPASVAGGQLLLAHAAAAEGELDQALAMNAQSLATYRALGDKRKQALILRRLGMLHLQRGDAAAAEPCFAEALALHQRLDNPIEAGCAEAEAARCAWALGRTEAALAAAKAVLARLDADGAGPPGRETVELRWPCQQVLAAAGDPAAPSLLEQLRADVRAHAAELADPADPTDLDRVLQAVPHFRTITAAHERAGRGPGAAPAESH